MEIETYMGVKRDSIKSMQLQVKDMTMLGSNLITETYNIKGSHECFRGKRKKRERESESVKKKKKILCNYGNDFRNI